MRGIGTLPRAAVAALVAAALMAGAVMGMGVAHQGDAEASALRSGPGGFAVVSSEAGDALGDDDLLRDAPWVNQAAGSPSIRAVSPLPALVFPPGTTYEQAIERLYVAVKVTGRLPDGLELGPALPREIVFARSASESALSLTAPFGYDIETGNVLWPSLYFPPSMTEQDIRDATRDAFASGRPIPSGATVVGNPLASCQVMIDNERPAACD